MPSICAATSVAGTTPCASIARSVDPSAARAGSLRRDVLDNWEELGLAERPNIGRNAVHGSADAEAAAHEIHTLFPLTMVKGETRTAEPSTEELVEVISAGMAELCRVKPEEPVSWLAEWMVANRNPADRNKKRLGDLLS